MKKLSIITIVFCNIGLLFSQENKTTFSLDEAKRYGVENHYNAKNSRIESELAEHSVKQLRAVGLPQINAEGTFQNFLNLPVSLVPSDAFGMPEYILDFFRGLSQLSGVPFNEPVTDPNQFSELKFGTKFNTSGALTVNQLFFDGSYFYGLKAAKAYADLNKQQEKKTAEDIQTEVEKAYYMVLIAQENIQLLTSSQKTLETILTQTKAFYEQGFIEEQDVEQLQLSLSSVQNSLNNAKLQYELALQMLKFQMGYDPAASISLTDALETLLADNQSLLLKNDFAASSTLTYQLMTQREKLLSLNTKVETSKIYPRLIGFFSHSENAYSNQFEIPKKFYPTTLWGLKLQVPLYNGGSYFSTVKKTKLEVDRIREAKKFTEQGLQLQYQAAQNEFSASVKEVEQMKSNLLLAEKIRNKTNTKFSAGISSSMDLAQSESQYLSAQGSYIASLLKLLNSKVSLKKINN